jgi:tRNA pseudouridine32 synthase / 23S rRNA pseudouridine746 synthase
MSSITPAEIVLYQDPAILVVNKPPGLLSLQDGYDRTLPHLTTVLAPEYGPLLIVHRLDRDTSGILILARTIVAHRSLNVQFQKRSVEKIYHTLVFGVPSWHEISANFPLRKNGDRKHRTVIDFKLGKKASTDFLLLEKFTQHSLIEARPHTGYTHQIRAHLAHLGFPVLADALYGSAESANQGPAPDLLASPVPIQRLALHACSITFTHPTRLDRVTFSAPYPTDFSNAILTLRQGG